MEFVFFLLNLILPIHTTFCFFFFSFTIIFSLFSLFIFFQRLSICCNCEICHAYVTSSWSKEFDNLCDWYTHLLKESPTGTIHIHVLGNTITANPDNVEHILTTRFDNYPKGKQFSALLGDLLGRGIFNVDGDKWRFQRKLASLELGSNSMRSFAFELVKTEIQTRLIPLLTEVMVSDENESVLDLQDVFRRFSFDTTCKFSFGLDPECLNLSKPISDFVIVFDAATKLSAERAMAASPIIWKMKRLLRIGSEKKLNESISWINHLAEQVIDQRRELGFSSKQDLLSRFMAIIDDDRKYLRDIVVSFLLAGRDTVAAGLTSFFWLLSQNPEVVVKIREEFDRVMDDPNNPNNLKNPNNPNNPNDPNPDPPTFTQLREMQYLHAAIYENLRLYPPVQFDSKFALEDDVLPDDTFIRKGTRVTYHPYAMGRMERIWGSDSVEFKPERWLRNGEFRPVSPFKFSVFQAGCRVCLGKEMAIMEIKCVALAILKRFDIRVVDPKHAPKFAPGLTASFLGGLPVLVERRSIC